MSKTLEQACREFSDAMRDLVWGIFKSLKIPELIEWLIKILECLNRKLHK